jgi:hypothetical protein
MMHANGGVDRAVDALLRAGAKSGVTETVSPVIKRVRAYFAPVNRTTKQPTIFDPSHIATFDVDAPSAPWIGLGWIDGFKRKSSTKVEALDSGAPAVAQMQVRSDVDATVEFVFATWGKLQLALACGTQQMNVLKTASGVSAAGSGGVAMSAVTLQAGSTATVLQVGIDAAATFAVGELLAVDVDYSGQTGFVGSGVSGAYVKSALSDVDYIRRVTLNVGRIASIADGALTLEVPLIAGAPADGMKVSTVVAFCDREGSSFFQEWSALFVGEGQRGERVVWHYPRLQSAAVAAESVTALAGGLEKLRLAGVFRALPVVDAVDGERVVCFRSYKG